MKNYFDEQNSVIKSTSTIHDRQVMRTLAIKLNVKQETDYFNIFSPYRKYIMITKQKVKIL